jgi:hypothetical protein
VLIVGILGAGVATVVVRSGEDTTTTDTAAPTTVATTAPTAPATTGPSGTTATTRPGATTTSPPLTQPPIGGGQATTPTTAFQAPTTAATTPATTATTRATTATTTPSPTVGGEGTATTTPSGASGLGTPGAGQVPTGGETARSGGESMLLPGLGLLGAGVLFRRLRRGRS